MLKTTWRFAFSAFRTFSLSSTHLAVS